jgi:hypothetical protein
MRHSVQVQRCVCNQPCVGIGSTQPHLPDAPATNTVSASSSRSSLSSARAAAAASSRIAPTVPIVPHTSSRARARRVVATTRWSATCTGRASAAAAAPVEQQALGRVVVADGPRCHRATPRTPRARATMFWACTTSTAAVSWQATVRTVGAGPSQLNASTGCCIAHGGRSTRAA